MALLIYYIIHNRLANHNGELVSAQICSIIPLLIFLNISSHYFTERVLGIPQQTEFYLGLANRSDMLSNDLIDFFIKLS